MSCALIPQDEYIPSSPLGPPPASQGPTRSAWVSCQDGLRSPPHSDHSDCDSPPDPNRKRARSQALSSPTPGLARRSNPKRPSRSSAPGPLETMERMETMDHCTQRCLLGLLSQAGLDLDCPNVDRHRRSQLTQRHLTDRFDFLRLLKAQLDESLDHYINSRRLLLSGAILAQVSLMPYGYTCIGKGTPDELQGDTLREAEVYGALRCYQGSAVPVYMGAIDIQRIFFVHPKICTKHMLLLFWAGDPIDITQIALGEALESYRRAAWAVKKTINGYTSIHPGNILWDSRRRQIQLVNFDSPKCRLRTLPLATFSSSRKRPLVGQSQSLKRHRVR
ncbi:hypothetical protein N7523_005612 [Penicillium sp. IBT 18751x]|nr:hypothetical protein N7523_005796 [Penicillium sp. IBT 18751x]KAJ6117861.1 hypothetical protein N7523_005612 [Penicillium sp. IBT 18751x]